MIHDPTDFASRLNVSRETLKKLQTYVDLVESWQRKVNLISSKTLVDIWPRHIWDSAQLAGFIDDDVDCILDVGSGAGFPGLVLAMMCDAEVHLVESDQKKSIFLQTVIRECQLRAVVHNARIEKLQTLNADIITARALAPVDRLLVLLEKQLDKSSRCLFLKGENVKAELACLDGREDISVKLHPSLTNPDAFVLDLTP
ncbi:16S rRNA (guanine(527)-N(7))-methyltransferase RsmG [SAR116 cluster bacterium]|nr:16S rRNA (guanine(527)-N(7))-methyltransferase RsmG [SAR116 cluster bacterium]